VTRVAPILTNIHSSYAVIWTQVTTISDEGFHANLSLWLSGLNQPRICDRWQRSNLESCLIAVCAASGKLMSQDTRTVGRGLCAGWLPATGSLNERASAARPTGARRPRGLAQRNKASIRLGAFTKYSTRFSTTHHPHTQTLKEAPWA